MYEFKVYGGVRNGVNRIIVATRTKKRAKELLKLSYDYFCETQNTEEKRRALAQPEIVLQLKI